MLTELNFRCLLQSVGKARRSLVRPGNVLRNPLLLHQTCYLFCIGVFWLRSLTPKVLVFFAFIRNGRAGVV